MNSEHLAAIERLRDLEKHVLPLNWQVDETNDENIVDSNGLFIAETCSDDDAALIVALRNEALPLIETLQAERDALQYELSSLKADMFVLNNDMGYTTGVLEDVLKQRDALQAECEALRRGHDKTHQRIDRALAALQESKQPALGQSFWRAIDKMVAAQNRAIEILTGEGENA